MSLQRIETYEDKVFDLSYVKTYLRVDHDHDDGLIEGFIGAARGAIEAYTSRSLVPQLWQFTVNAGFAVARSDESYLSHSKSRGSRGIELPRSPFIALEGHPKVTTAYGEKELKDYRLDAAGRTARIHFGDGS